MTTQRLLVQIPLKITFCSRNFFATFPRLSTQSILYCSWRTRLPERNVSLLWPIRQPTQKPFHGENSNKYKDVHCITFQAFSFGHLVEVLLKVINEISAITHEERKCTDILGEVMTVLLGLAHSKSTEDAKGTFASKGANQVNCKV